MILEHPVARIYAESMIGLGEEHGELAAFDEQLCFLRDYLADHEPFRRYLESPSVPEAEKKELIGRAFEGFSPLLRNMLFLIIDRHRELILSRIAEAYHSLYLEHENKLPVKVTVAVGVDEFDPAGLEAVIRKKTGKDPVLDVRSDPAIIGGLILRIGDTQIDASLRTRLKRLRRHFETVAIPKEVAYEA